MVKINMWDGYDSLEHHPGKFLLPPHGYFVAYTDTIGVKRLLVGFHETGEEDRIQGYQLSSVRPGLYRDSSHQITAVVVTCSCAVHLSMAYRPVLQHEALRVWRRWPHWCNYAVIISVSSRLLKPCCLCKLCISKMFGLP